MCLALAACGESASRPGPREPAAAPRVHLSAEDRERWAPAPATGEATSVPVLLYHRLPPRTFARQMMLLESAGYDTITLDQLIRFVNDETVTLPPRPLLLTFDGGRIATWRESDAILRERGFNAVLLVDVGRVVEEDPAYLTWAELNRLQGSGRWDVQLQSGTGNYIIKWGPGPGDIGPFYTYRGSEEVFNGWRERVFSDVTYAVNQLTRHVRQYRPLAFAPPYGNYGQAGTNDRRIPRVFLTRLQQSFELVFTQDRSGLATAGAPNPLGRIEITPRVTDAELRALLEQN